MMLHNSAALFPIELLIGYKRPQKTERNDYPCTLSDSEAVTVSAHACRSGTIVELTVSAAG